MRRLTTLAKDDAARFGEILEAERIGHRVDALGSDEAEVWVHRDDELDTARELLEAWQTDPSDPRFQGASRAVRELRREREAEQARIAANKELRDRASRPVTVGVVTLGILGVSVICTLLGIGGLANLASAMFELPYPQGVYYLFIDELMIVVEGTQVYVPYLYMVRQGEIWRLFTPPFVHTGGLFHLAFNAYWTVLLGSQIETRKGPDYLIILVLMTGMLSSLGQYTVGWSLIDLQRLAMGIPADYGLFGRIYLGGALGGGLSGVVYGLLGYILVKSKVDPKSGLEVSPTTVAVLLIWLLACFAGRPEVHAATGATYTVGIAGNIANIAHLGGLLSGALWGLVSHRIRPSW